MALKKPTPASTPATSTQFENEPGEVATENVKATADAPEAQAEPPVSNEAKVAATTAIAAASAGSVATVNDNVAAAKRFAKEVADMKGAADFTYGSHRVFKAKDGVIKETSGDKLVLGRWLKGRLLAWDRHFEISPGEDGASSAEFVAYSNDGETVDQVVGEEQRSWVGKSVADYVEYLRTTEDFDKAGKREFFDLQVAALGSEEEPAFSEVVQVTLSSSSIPAFRKYQSGLEARAKCVVMGLPGYTVPEDPFTLYFIREAAEKGKNSWTKLKITDTLPAKI